MEFYNINNLVSNGDCNFFFSTGARGIGKSYSAKKYVLKKWKYKKEQFIYIRRHDVDIKLTAENYFNDVLLSKQFSEMSMKYRGNKYYINGEVVGYAYPLSGITKLKSSSFPNVSTIIFDEFIAEDGKYLGGKENPQQEIFLVNNIYDTVARLRKNVKFIFLSNSVSIINPYFTEYGFDRKIIEGAKRYKTKDKVFELSEAPEVTEYIKSTTRGKALEGTEYGDYAINNNFNGDNKNFIVKDIPKHLKYLYTLCYVNRNFGVWIDKKTNLYYITDKYDPSCLTKFSLTDEAHNIDTILIKNNSSSTIVKMLKTAYSYNKIRFKSQTCKYILLAFLGI